MQTRFQLPACSQPDFVADITELIDHWTDKSYIAQRLRIFINVCYPVLLVQTDQARQLFFDFITGKIMIPTVLSGLTDWHQFNKADTDGMIDGKLYKIKDLTIVDSLDDDDIQLQRC